jgi:hypothetical protein
MNQTAIIVLTLEAVKNAFAMLKERATVDELWRNIEEED